MDYALGIRPFVNHGSMSREGREQTESPESPQ